MYRFSLKLQKRNIDRLRKLQRELKEMLGQHFSMNQIIEAILQNGLDLIEANNEFSKETKGKV